ncbi:MAG TPA: hypothetical protein EYN05_04390 [Nitrospinaceae bacterium]|jgi:hypothetical protein|nr:hypothetical protein [Nitrospina sp.]HIN87880.1 hypothetical protein [Nitrospinaceae bacterium]|tara:strand:+ start:1646 stop:2311 length:666 start_codon:yes stop_codon:yes gene_type:complete
MPVHFTFIESMETDTTESFFSERFLRARIDDNKPSSKKYDPILEEGRSETWIQSHEKEIKQNDLEYEEDVNQYITLMLAEMVNPKTTGLTNQYLVGTDSDAGQIAIDLKLESQKYQVFRTNADFLLFHLGLFSPQSNILGDKYFDKGGWYYRSAACSLKHARGGRSGLSDVLEKLSLKFGKYVEILRYMKNRSSNYFSFHFKFSEEEIARFQKQLSKESKS